MNSGARMASRPPEGSRKKSAPPAADFLRRLPKVDLHCHLDGSLRPQTVLELAKEQGAKLPAADAESLRAFVQVSPQCRSLREFLDVFDLLYPLLRRAGAVERVAYELIEDCAAENIRHVEVRFAPILQETKGFSADAVIEAALKGLRRGRRDFGTTSSVIVCLFRSHGPQENRRAFSALKRFFKADASPQDPAVVGLDLAGDEARFPTREYADFYGEARRLGIWTTCHAGETAGTENLSAALDMRVHRIGHGIHLMEDARLLSEVVRRRVPLEIGISSNVRTQSVPSLQKHPALDFHRAGVPITLNTDDRGIIGIDLTHEYASALKIGFSLDALCRIAVDSIDHLFLPPRHRRRFKTEFSGEIARLRAGRRFQLMEAPAR